MPKKELVTKVWIEPGCIVCDACETAAPDVFDVQEETCVIRPAALETAFTKPRTASIIEAAQECPVDVIKYATQEVELSEAEIQAMGLGEQTQEAAPAAAVSASAPVAKPDDAAKHEAPAPVKTPPARAPVAASAPADLGDPGLQALLKAATARGGRAGITKRQGALGDPLSRDPKSLPPDARHVKMLETAKKVKEGATRREMLSGSALALAAGWTTFAVGTGVMVGPAGLSFSMPRALEEPDPRVRVGPVKRFADMKPGEVNEDFKPKGIWMIREEEKIAALNIICTHLGCIPNWLPNDRIFLCPCHGSGYYFNGVNFQGPTPRPLERFRVYIDEGTLVVDKSKKFQHELGQWEMPESYLSV